jgi:hypothetical protein
MTLFCADVIVVLRVDSLKYFNYRLRVRGVMRITFFLILGLCAVQQCSAAEVLAAQPVPVQCEPKSLLAKDIVLYERCQAVLEALTGMPESAELTQCIW